MNNSLVITGNLVWVGEETEITSKKGTTWRKKEFVMDLSDGDYSQNAQFILIGNAVDLVRSDMVDHQLRVCFSLSSREYNGRWYNDHKVFSVVDETAVAERYPNGPENPSARTSRPAQSAQPKRQYTQPTPAGSDNESDDLPW